MDAKKKRQTRRSAWEMRRVLLAAEIQARCDDLAASVAFLGLSISFAGGQKDEDDAVHQIERRMRLVVSLLRPYQHLRFTHQRRTIRRWELAMSVPAYKQGEQ